MAVATKTFLSGIGFRKAGTMLASPVSAVQGARTLTVLRLVATPDATDLVYEVTHLPDDESTFPTPQRHGMDNVLLVVGEQKFGMGGAMNIAVRQGKLVRTFTMVPLPEGTTDVELRVSGPSIGEWNVPLKLVPFPANEDARYRDVGASDAKHGVTVTVRGAVIGGAETVLDLVVLHEAAGTKVWGLGGMNMRDASTALVLRDDKGRTYVERFRNDARDQLPDPSGIADVAIFDALPDDAEELELDVSTVCFDDQRGMLDIELPVESPFDARLGDYPLRVLGSRAVTVKRGGREMNAVVIDLDLGDTSDPLCVIKPAMAKADGEMSGFGFGGKGIHGPSPEPLDSVEIFYQGATPPKRATFSGATVRARGPWRIRFTRPR